MEKENRSSILSAIYSRTKLIGLIALIAEALFLGALATLPSSQILFALLACAFILVICIVGIIYVEAIAERSSNSKTFLDAKHEREESTASSQEQFSN